MQRHLLIARHAQSGWDGDPPTDHERTLTAQGLAQARGLAELLRARGWTPELMVCSTAQRAAHTAQLVHEALGVEAELVPIQALYQGGLQTVRDTLSVMAEGAARVMVVGHNPTMSHVASHLSGQRLSLRPATCVALSRQSDSWEEALEEGWTLDALLHPGQV